ncbi:MAG: 16S rRNA (guanine(966)-N(2))-methyltransferase RsmD [Chloroflexota bacterium]
MTNLRVIGGKARGRKLQIVPGDTTRPITDQVKEALFNIIGNDIEGATLLDLFGGTGAVGIEALSRGAAFVRMLDLNRRAVAIMRANLAHCDLQDGAEVQQADAFKVLESAPDRAFEYVYIAPPQYKEMWKKALHLLDGNPGWMSPDAWVIVQIHPVEYETPTLLTIEAFDRRQYGGTTLLFYQKK